MRDFESDVIHAALAGQPVPASDFSWSPMRHLLFMICRRAYFIRYYLAQGGWNVHSHSLAKTAYLEKHLPPYRIWLARTARQCVADSICEAFREPDAVLRRRLFRTELMKNIRGSVSSLMMSLEQEAYLSDPKLPGFLEYLREEPGFRDTDRLMPQIVQAFARMVHGLENTLEPLLDQLNHTDLRVGEPFLMLPYHSFPVWSSAGIVYEYGDMLASLHFEYSGNLGMTTVPVDQAEDVRKIEHGIFQQFARLRRPDRKTDFSILRFSENEAETVPAPDPIDLADVIDGSSEAMLALIGGNGTVRIEDFPCDAAGPDVCRNCPFRMTCGDLKHGEKNV